MTNPGLLADIAKGIVRAELLTEITQREIGRYISDDGYGCEEKHNGQRKIVYKDASGIPTTNREGEPSGHALPTHVINAFRHHPLPTFVIDIEFENGIAVILDILNLGGLDFTGQRYDKRKAAARLAFEGNNRNAFYRVCETITGEFAKSAFVRAKKAEKAEGVCFKKMDAPYRSGRSDQHKKLKFVKECDVVVMGPNLEGHNSVEIGVYDKGILRRVSGCSLNGKPNAVKGDVLTVRYLYASKNFNLVQPTMVCKRTDKRPETCTIDQLERYRDYR